MDTQVKYRAYICHGPNCGPKGSPALLTFLEQEVRRLCLEDRVTVIAGSCMSHCDNGPSMVVYPGPVFYQEVDRERIRRIVAEHLAGDRPVSEFRWVQPRKSRTLVPTSQPGLARSLPQPPSPAHKGNGDKQQKAKKHYEVDDFKW